MSSVAVADKADVREAPFEAELSQIRRLAHLMPGALPTAVNGIRVAASVRPHRFAIDGGDDTPVTMPRTAFQVVYPDCTVMIDSGLDRETHDSFSTPDKREPYFADQFSRLQQALNAARMIVLTHFHADHVVSVATAQCLLNTPHRPHLAMSADKINQFNIFDYGLYDLIAPGMVLIRAPGHSADHQMVYIALASGAEILHSVDVGWVMKNIRQIKGKAAPWVKEDVPAVLGQLRWLNRIYREEPNVTLLVTHDDRQFDDAVRSGAIGGELKI
jgi:glyoxylase-like metal-dependent hydrolase (beta-lactamase superfamily II)